MLPIRTGGEDAGRRGADSRPLAAPKALYQKQWERDGVDFGGWLVAPAEAEGRRAQWGVSTLGSPSRSDGKEAGGKREEEAPRWGDGRAATVTRCTPRRRRKNEPAGGRDSSGAKTVCQNVGRPRREEGRG
ncbi:hypothetical protein NL676_007194 [Syzygium grande]|nr:hypothetical protein NL676_007194 [Syzygium grande]